VRQIEFHKECGDDNVCEPELTLTWLQVGGVVVGSRSAMGAQVIANLQVTNTGETAYWVKLNVTFPRPSLQFAAATPEHSVCIVNCFRLTPEKCVIVSTCTPVSYRSLP